MLTSEQYNEQKIVMERKALVSVIVPIYNVEPYLRECISSIRNQTMGNMEIILVDDGSTDRCPQMCDQLAAEDARIRVYHQANAGVSAARNQGIKLAVADWLMFVDPDDWLEENAVEILYEKALQTQCEIVCASLYFNYPQKQVQMRMAADGTKEYLVAQNMNFLLEYVMYASKPGKEIDLGNPVAKIYRAAYLKENQVRFPVGLKMCEDKIFNLYAVRHAEKICLMDLPLYHYRMRKGSACHTLFPDYQDILLRFLEEMHAFMESCPEVEYLWPSCRFVAFNLMYALVTVQSTGVRNLETLCRAARTIKESAEGPECAAVIAGPVPARLSPKRKLGFYLLKRKMYRTLVAIDCVYRKLFKRGDAI